MFSLVTVNLITFWPRRRGFGRTAVRGGYVIEQVALGRFSSECFFSADKKRSHKKRTRDPWNTRREIQKQTKLDQPSWKNERHQIPETRPQLQTSRKKRSWKPQEMTATRRCWNRSNDLIHGGRWWWLRLCFFPCQYQSTMPLHIHWSYEAIQNVPGLKVDNSGLNSRGNPEVRNFTFTCNPISSCYWVSSISKCRGCALVLSILNTRGQYWSTDLQVLGHSDITSASSDQTVL
jgi:hypothetical protein